MNSFKTTAIAMSQERGEEDEDIYLVTKAMGWTAGSLNLARLGFCRMYYDKLILTSISLEKVDRK